MKPRVHSHQWLRERHDCQHYIIRTSGMILIKYQHRAGGELLIEKGFPKSQIFYNFSSEPWNFRGKNGARFSDASSCCTKMKKKKVWTFNNFFLSAKIHFSIMHTFVLFFAKRYRKVRCHDIYQLSSFSYRSSIHPIVDRDWSSMTTDVKRYQSTK